MSAPIPVYLELGAHRVFACAVDWPGWCRSGRNEERALEALAAAAPRYERVATEAGERLSFDARVGVEAVERIPGSTATDFGVPAEPRPGDREPLAESEAARLAAIVAASWRIFDRVAAVAPPELRKGPRGGGRDRDKIVAHVVAAEAMYARKLGIRLRPPAIGDRAAIIALRDEIVAALRSATGPTAIPHGWPARYAARRIAWHVLDHAWEIEDRSQGEAP